MSDRPDPAVLLVDWYRDAARGQARSLAAGNSEDANRHFAEMKSLYADLKALGGDAAGALLPLLDTAEPDVALSAASVLLWDYPDEAEAALRQLAETRGLIGFTAQMTLREWKAGRMRPLNA